MGYWCVGSDVKGSDLSFFSALWDLLTATDGSRPINDARDVQSQTGNQSSIALYCIALRCIALRCIALRCIALHCIALCCIALLCVALRCVALYCIALHCIVLHCVALLCVVLHCIALLCVALYCIALYCIALHCIALLCFALRCIALHCIALHCIALHCVGLRCIVLHCIALYYKFVGGWRRMSLALVGHRKGIRPLTLCSNFPTWNALSLHSSFSLPSFSCLWRTLWDGVKENVWIGKLRESSQVGTGKVRIEGWLLKNQRVCLLYWHLVYNVDVSSPCCSTSF